MAKPAKNRLEWTVFAISLALVLATLGFLVRESVVRGQGPPDILVRLGPPHAARGGWLVPVEVANAGGSTAEDLRVPVRLDLPGGPREEAELSIAFLARGSTRTGWVRFRSDPRRGTLSLGGLGFEVP